tara:strand:+ start:202 stop:471 length:270 start_codon:yes stop_codon:yes gene_type:complete
MRILVFISFLFFTTTYGQSQPKIKNKDHGFLEQKVKDPALQKEIDNLRYNFEKELSVLKKKHKDDKKNLRKIFRIKLKSAKKMHKKNKK